jgi:hypothetical protein
MDLASILALLHRYKWVSLPILLLTALALGYVGLVRAPVYESSAQILLLNPPTQATKQQQATVPGLKKTDPFNSFATYGSLQVVANAMIEYVSSPAAAPELAAAHVGRQFKIALSTDYGDPPLIDITGEGVSRAAAIDSAKGVTAALQNELAAMQRKSGVAPFYMITTQTIVPSITATPSNSGKVRSMVAVAALGILVLFIAISAADAAKRRRRPVPPQADVQETAVSPVPEENGEAVSVPEDAWDAAPEDSPLQTAGRDDSV